MCSGARDTLDSACAALSGLQICALCAEQAPQERKSALELFAEAKALLVTTDAALPDEPLSACTVIHIDLPRDKDAYVKRLTALSGGAQSRSSVVVLSLAEAESVRTLERDLGLTLYEFHAHT